MHVMLFCVLSYGAPGPGTGPWLRLAPHHSSYASKIVRAGVAQCTIINIMIKSIYNTYLHNTQSISWNVEALQASSPCTRLDRRSKLPVTPVALTLQYVDGG